MRVEIMVPKSREEWLSVRGKTLGASEIAATLGVHPFMTAFELHHVKAGTIVVDPSETPPMRRGRHLEEVAVKFLREEMPSCKVTANVIGDGGKFYRDLDLGLSCTPDAFISDPSRKGYGIAQIKSVEPSVYRTKWHEDGEVQVPIYIAVQAVQEAFLTGATWAVVCPLVIGFGIEMPVLEVPMHAGVMERIKTEAASFWKGVRDGIAPEPDYARDSAAIAAMYREDNAQELDLTTINHLPELLAERDVLKAEIKIRCDRVDEIDCELKSRIGSYESALVAGRRRITWRTEHRRHRFVAPSETRVLRVSAVR